jgi:hypothetical protein
MSDVLWATLIGGGLGILASLITQVVGGTFAERQLRHQAQQAAQNRTWALEDAKRARAIEVIERRCNQAEQIVTTLTEEFQRLLQDAWLFLSVSEKEQAMQAQSEYLAWRKTRDFKPFTGKPAILSLRDDELANAFQRMGQATNDMGNHADFNYEQKFLAGQPVDSGAQIGRMQVTRQAFDSASADFYARLDKIRIAAAQDAYSALSFTVAPTGTKHE